MNSISEKTSVAWMQGSQDWAFKHLCEHLRPELPDCEHRINSDSGANVRFLVCPSQLAKFPDKKNIVQHIDSNRWYEKQ